MNGLQGKIGIFMRYLMSGGIAAIVHFAILIFLVELVSVNATLASSIGFCAAVIVNYTLQYHWTFKVNETHRTVFARYAGVTATTLVINTALFWTLHERLVLPYLMAQVIVTGVVVLINFTINQRYTFAKSSQAR